jgi:urease gamma subunit
LSYASHTTRNDKLALHQAGYLAQKRLARGLRLNYPEAVALIATQILELIRDGRSVAELMNLGRQLLGRADVMEHVPEMIVEVQVEGTFPDGSKLVTVHHPDRGRARQSGAGALRKLPSGSCASRLPTAKGDAEVSACPVKSPQTAETSCSTKAGIPSRCG